MRNAILVHQFILVLQAFARFANLTSQSFAFRARFASSQASAPMTLAPRQILLTQVYLHIYFTRSSTNMPQVSLYIDKDTLKKIELAAKKENVSISHWVRDRIETSLSTDWPKDFFDLWGSIPDPSFRIPKKVGFKSDASREKL